jgi:hypothetical protein
MPIRQLGDSSIVSVLRQSGSRARALQENESGEGDSLVKVGPVKGVSDEKQEFGLRMGQGGRVLYHFG